MSNMGSNVFAWNASSSSDVVSYRLRIKPTPATFTKADPFADLGKVLQVDISTLPAFATLNGVYDMALTAVDAAKNESKFTVLAQVPLDLVPPDAPTNFRRLP